MFSRRVTWILLLGLCDAGAAAGQGLKLRESSPAARPSAVHRLSVEAAPVAPKVAPVPASRAWMVPAPTGGEYARASIDLPQKSSVRFAQVTEQVPLRIEAEKTSLLTEARIPIAELWSGRLRLAGVQQRFHSANVYSMASVSDGEPVAVAPGLASVVARPRVNYGVGLQLRFGR